MSSFYSGKIILSGEHSVVYGHKAILANLDLGIKCSIKEGLLTEAQEKDTYLQHVLQIFAELAKIEKYKIALKIESNLPLKSGLGSSAAFAAAVFSELAKFYDYPLKQDRLYKLVLQAENFIHGQSSGADPAIVVYGGLIAFSKGEIEHLNIKVLLDQTFFLIDSGVASESTGEMVAKVAADKANLVVINKIAGISQEMITNLKDNSFNPKILDRNELLLEKIAVAGERAKKIIKQLQELGASCKITGAGGIKAGSGFILAFHANSEKFEQDLKNTGLNFFKTQLGKTNEKS